MLAALRYLEPSDDIRSSFQYSNLGYLVASMITERVSGQSWADFTRIRLTDRLGMDVTFSVEDLGASTNVAEYYTMNGDTSRRTKRWPVAVPAAGGLWTSIASLASWLRFHLGEGAFEGQQLVTAASIRQLQAPRVHVGPSGLAEVSDVHYGLGLRTHRYRGERVVWHGGGWTGTFALMTMLPDRGVGVAILANGNLAPEIITSSVFDRVCGLEPIPWLDRHRDLRRKFLAERDASRQAPKATGWPNTQPSHELGDYAGDYEHPGYGRITITHVDGRLNWAFRGMSEPLTHRHHDTFELPGTPESPGGLLPGRLAVSFSVDRDGNIASLAVPFEPLVKDIVFVARRA
jgi:hypothetical protein